LEILYTNSAPEPIGPYSQGVISGNLLYLSGQIGINPISGELRNNVEAQTRQAIANITHILNTKDVYIQNVIKTTCFLTEPDDFEIFNKIYGEYFSHKPARSCVFVKGLPKNAKVEIEVLATLVD
jgi:2-iminobutanoate/2-iminopropanoate deaminase